MPSELSRESAPDELVVHAHRGYVQSITRPSTSPSKSGAPGVFGVCSSCGWQGPDRDSAEQARADVDGHIARTGYRWDDVAKRMVPRG